MDQFSTQLDYEFEGFRLDTWQQVLIPTAGEPIPLPPRVFRTLLYLVEHAGEPVDKRSVMAAVWPDVVVEENNLNQAIVAIRKALGETAGERRFILTLPGRGFKFVAPVRSVVVDRSRPSLTRDAASVDMAAPVGSAAGGGDPLVVSRSVRRTAVVGAALAVVAALVALGTWWFYRLRSMPVTNPGEYEALTDELEPASAPTLSPDGRLLAYVRGGSQFMGPGQIYVKWLPGGQPIRLTNVDGLIFAPSFSKDGGRVAFTWVRERRTPSEWETWTVPVIGGEPVRLLPNASGLTWIGDGRLLYSEVRSGAHMGIVTSTESRAEHRQIYLPEHERGMAHFSFMSPDRKSVLVAEMDKTGTFRRCRLVPFDGSNSGVAVGPDGSCISAAWSPDGVWMYFAAEVSGRFHLWRQSSPQRAAQQITFGPTEEMAVVAAPDGRSLVTSLANDESSIWIHDAEGERRITEDKYAINPRLNADGQHLYFLRLSTSHGVELMRKDLHSGTVEPLLPGLPIDHFDISADEREIVYTTVEGGQPRVWIAPADRSTPPKQLLVGGDEAVFGGNHQIFYRQIGANENFLYRVSSAGGRGDRVLAAPILDLFAASPDGNWVSVGAKRENGIGEALIADTRSGEVRWSREGWWPARWSADGRWFYLDVSRVKGETPEDDSATWVAETGADGLPPDLSRAGESPELSKAGLGSSEMIPRSLGWIAPGSDPGHYAFVKLTRRRNIYRIPLH